MAVLYRRFGREMVISSRSKPGRPPLRARPPSRDSDEEADDAAIFWPSRSPDLLAPDFFLWGYLKDRVYDVRTVPGESVDLPALRANIEREIDVLNRDGTNILSRVMSHVMERARACVRSNGEYLTEIVFRTTRPPS